MWAVLSAVLLVLLILAFILLLDRRYRPQPQTDVVVIEQETWPWWFHSDGGSWGTYWRHGGRGIHPTPHDGPRSGPRSGPHRH
jgi:hypothetical protein